MLNDAKTAIVNIIIVILNPPIQSITIKKMIKGRATRAYPKSFFILN